MRHRAWRLEQPDVCTYSSSIKGGGDLLWWYLLNGRPCVLVHELRVVRAVIHVEEARAESDVLYKVSVCGKLA